MTKRSIAVALALLLAAVALPLAPRPAMANPGSQYWYLTDFTSGVSGADYIMYRASGNGGVDAEVPIAAAASKTWSADEAANVALDMSGDWSVTLSAKGNKASATVHIGTLSGGSFTSKGSTTQVLTANLQSWGFTVTTTDHSIAADDYLAAQISVTGADAVIDVSGATNSDSYIISPTAAPDYPGTVTISFTVTDYGSAGINFGSLAGGTSNNAESDQGTTFVSGNATGGSTTTLEDTGKNFVTLDVAVGMTIESATESSTITVVTSTVLTFSPAMTTPFASTAPYTIKSGAVKLTVGAETNVNCSIEIKGDAFDITIVGGTADSGSSTTMVDSGADFSGVSINDILINETDGSTATLTGVDDGTDTLTFSGGLSGGSDNTFETGDAYSVKEASPAYTIDIGNAKWDTDSDVTGATAMTGTYAQITTSTAGSLTEQDIWHWLSIPNGQAAGDYTGMFYYQAIQQ